MYLARVSSIFSKPYIQYLRIVPREMLRLVPPPVIGIVCIPLVFRVPSHFLFAEDIGLSESDTYSREAVQMISQDTILLLFVFSGSIILSFTYIIRLKLTYGSSAAILLSVKLIMHQI